MNTHGRNPGFPGVPSGAALVFDSETGTMQDEASVRDRLSYHRYLMMCARLAEGNKDEPSEEASAGKADGL